MDLDLSIARIAEAARIIDPVVLNTPLGNPEWVVNGLAGRQRDVVVDHPEAVSLHEPHRRAAQRTALGDPVAVTSSVKGLLQTGRPPGEILRRRCKLVHELRSSQVGAADVGPLRLEYGCHVPTTYPVFRSGPSETEALLGHLHGRTIGKRQLEQQ